MPYCHTIAAVNNYMNFRKLAIFLSLSTRKQRYKSHYLHRKLYKKLRNYVQSLTKLTYTRLLDIPKTYSEEIYRLMTVAIKTYDIGKMANEFPSFAE